MRNENCPYCGEPRHFHTKKWYMSEWKINPERLGIKPLLTRNAYGSFKIKLYAECQVKIEQEKHPELTIKPRTEKQKKATEKLVAINEDQNKILWKIERRDDDRSHAEYHEREGLHYHTEEELKRMISDAEGLNPEINRMCEEFRKKWERDPWIIS